MTLICTSLQLCPLTCLESSFVFMLPLAWWCPLLSGVADSGAFQNICKYWDHVTLWMHTCGLYLTNYVTSEGNWLHLILFRGFIAKGVNTYARTTFLFWIFWHFLKHVIFFISHHQFGLLCMSITLNPNKNQFKLHVVMQQNRKNAKGVNTFARHCRYAVLETVLRPVSITWQLRNFDSAQGCRSEGCGFTDHHGQE